MQAGSEDGNYSPRTFGGVEGTIDWVVDGATRVDPQWGHEPHAGPGLDAIQEFTVESNAVSTKHSRTVVRVSLRVADIPVVQRLTLYRALKRLDIENTVEWSRPRFVRLQQLFPLPQSNAEIHYEVPFGSNVSTNVMPGSGPRAVDEIKKDSWQGSRHIQGWVDAGNADWGVTLSAERHQIRIADGLIRAQMLRGARYSSVRVVRGDEVTSMFYPPNGSYVFRYSLSSGKGDWRARKAYRAGLAFTNPVQAVEVADRVSTKTLPPERSFCSLKQDSLVVSAVKKSDLDSSVLVRVYEIEGAPVESTFEFLGMRPEFGQTNLLEETIPTPTKRSFQAAPYAIQTLKVAVRQ